MAFNAHLTVFFYICPSIKRQFAQTPFYPIRLYRLLSSTNSMKSQDIEHLKNTIQKAKDINDIDRTKLLELLNTFSGYGLVWVDKQEDNENKILNGQMPVLNENLDRLIVAHQIPQMDIQTNIQTEIAFEDIEIVKNEVILMETTAPHHLLIEGDNLPALTALTYTHEGLVDVIYIDPPYNTGNKDFKYNDRFVDKEDPYRHSKWLSFMHKRLLLAHKLLKSTGVIFISIDDNEQANLKLLCDEVFDEKNFIDNIIWEKNYSPRNDSKFFSASHDFILVYHKGFWKRNLLERTDKQNAAYKHNDNNGRGLWRSDNLLVKTFSPSGVYPIVNPNTNVEYLPPKGSCWRLSKAKAETYLSENRLYFGKDGKGAPQLKRYLNEVIQGVVPLTIWKYGEVGHTQDGKNELKEMMLGERAFETPKPSRLIKHIIQLSTQKDIKETPSVILDFFAGSGTTLHAVMQLNAEDGGNRQCILVTNNENNIAEEVCYERNKRVINGYTKPNGTAVKGLTNNHLHYYQLDWFDELAAPLSIEKPNEHSSIRLARLMREMLMIKENCFEDIETDILRGYHPDLRFKDDNHPDLDVLENDTQYVVIIYTDDAISDGVSIIEKLAHPEKPVIVYTFEYQGEPDPTPFEMVRERVKLKALPSSYKETYDHILQDLRKRRRRFVISDEDVEIEVV